MNDFVREQARELGRLLTESEEHKRLAKARATVEGHEAAKVMLRDFRARQEDLETKRRNGEKIEDHELKELRDFSQILYYNPYIRELIDAEMAFAGLMMEVQRVLAEPLGLGALEQAEGSETEPPAASQPERDRPQVIRPKSKLWVPPR
ncbi:MAG: YlbF family regulator [Firmicutes bacterium]|nr:YlbF family regulator [Bacillota bacterium]